MGFAKVSDLTTYLTVQELEKWQAFFALEPWGYKVETHRAGVMTATLANFIGGLEGHHALKPSDIFPDRQSTTEYKTPSIESMKAFGNSLKMLNGK